MVRDEELKCLESNVTREAAVSDKRMAIIAEVEAEAEATESLPRLTNACMPAPLLI
jgi:hypothetical protein